MSVGQYVNLLLDRLKFFENFDWKTSTSVCIQIEGEEKTIILTKVAEYNTKRYARLCVQTILVHCLLPFSSCGAEVVRKIFLRACSM